MHGHLRFEALEKIPMATAEVLRDASEGSEMLVGAGQPLPGMAQDTEVGI